MWFTEQSIKTAYIALSVQRITKYNHINFGWRLKERSQVK